MTLARLALPAVLVLAVPLAGCGNKSHDEPTVKQESVQVAGAGAFRVGDHLMVDWKGKVYPTSVLQVVDKDHVKIHYDGFESSWDEVVGRDRVRGRAGGTGAAPAARANPFPAVDDHGRAVDGLPSVIPPPGSAPPSVAEWNGVSYEITVKGSSAHNCETKMLREWLRVSCHPKAPFTPSGVTTKQSAGQQAFIGKFGDLTSVVVQVVHGKDYQAEFVWSEGGRSSAANLHVHWPSNEPRPQLYFDR